tara:strand:- start:644 stop:853 length:210 start_codon:yes stop_codon:yes gene_type:complete
MNFVDHFVSYADPIGNSLYAVTSSDISRPLLVGLEPYDTDKRVLQESSQERDSRIELMRHTKLLGRVNN